MFPARAGAEFMMQSLAMPSTIRGLGLVVLDDQLFVDRHPDVDTKVFATSHRMQLGGPVPTALAQLRRLNVESTFLGSWADDDPGRSIERRLEAAGIDYEARSCRTANSTGIAQIWVEQESGRRTVVSFPPAGTPDADHALEFGRSARLLHLDGWGGEAAVAAATACREAGGVVTFDCGSIKPATSRLLPLANVVNVPRRFLYDYCGTGDAATGAKMLLDVGPYRVTVTDGENGAGVYTRDVALWLPAFRVKAVDTCGAGDVFCGGLIYGVLADYEPDAMLRFAMATAALKIGRAGNDALAGYDEVVTLLETAGE